MKKIFDQRDSLEQSMLASFRIGLARLGLDGSMLYADSCILRLLRYPNLETLQKAKPSELWLNLDAWSAFVRQLQKSPGQYNCLAALLRRDGSTMWAELSARLVCGPQGQAKAIEAGIQDITGQRAVAERDWRSMLSQLEASEQRFRMLMEHTSDGVFLIDGEGRFVYASPSASQILGAGVENHIGKHIIDVLPEQEQAQIQPLLQYVLNFPGERMPFLHGHTRPDGSRLWVEGSAVNLLNEPAVKGILVNFRDVTERVSDGDRLRESEARFRSMAENIQDGLSIIQNGKIIYTNPRVSEILGIYPGEPVNTALLELAAPGEHERLQQMIDSAGETGSLPETVSFWITRKDGSRRYIQNRYSVSQRRKDDPEYYVITTDITGQKLAEDELRFRADFERLIIETSMQLINVRPEQMIEALNSTLKKVGEFTGVDRCQIFLFVDNQTKMDCIASWSRGGVHTFGIDELQGIPANASPWWFEQIRSRKVVYFSSPANLPKEEMQLRKVTGRLNEQTVMDVPIIASGRASDSKPEGEVIGYLRLASVRHERPWSEEEIALQKLLAEMIANVMERREFEAKIKRQLENMAALHTIDKAITSQVELQSVLKVLLEQVVSQLHVDAADILLHENGAGENGRLASGEPDGCPVGRLIYGAGVGFQRIDPARRDGHLDNPLIQQILKYRRMQSAFIPRQWRSLYYDEGFVAYFGVPLIAKNQVNGILELYHRAPFEAKPDWLSFLSMLAEQAAIAIDNVTLFQNLQCKHSELIEAYDTTLEGWAQALELRDHETEGHCRRVTELAVRLAKEMGLKDEELVHFRRGALLHDIGKMSIPDAILHKKGELTPEEWEIMRQHPVYSYQLLSPIPFLAPALDIPYYHHEHWNGSGYPHGLKGEEIPLAARIFAVVDVWDALCTDRAYRNAWNPKRVRSYLASQAGELFDPKVVETFLRMMEEE